MYIDFWPRPTEKLGFHYENVDLRRAIHQQSKFKSFTSGDFFIV